MADLDNTQTKRAGLPAKKWFTLEEIAKRWGCPVDDLLHYGETENLEICFNFSRVVVQWGFWKDGGGESQAQYYFVPLTDNEAWIGLLKLDAQGIRMAKVNQGTPEVLYWPHGRLFAGRLLDFVMGGDSSITGGDTILGSFYRGAVDKDRTEQINMEGLAVTRTERDRFEKKHRIGAYAGTITDRLDPHFLLPKPSAEPATAAGGNKAGENKAGWKDEAREHYRALRAKHPSLSKAQLSEKIAPLIQTKGRGGKPVTAETIGRHALQNLE